MPGKISILKDNGETLNSNIVSVFTMPETEKKYIITTENTVDPHGLTVLHVSELVDDTLARIATTEEWDAIKNIMRVVIAGNTGSYTYLPSIASARANGQYSRDISVSDTAVKQLSDAYLASQTTQDGGSQPAFATADNLNQMDINAVPVVAAPPAPNQVVPENMGMPSANDVVTPVVPSNVAPTPVVAQPSSIFPENNVVPTEENEVIPGISEIGADQNVNSLSKPVLSPAESTLPINPVQSAQLTATVEPIMPISVTPVMENPVPQQGQQMMDVSQASAPAFQPNIEMPAPALQPLQPNVEQNSVVSAPVIPQAQVVQPTQIPSDVPSVSLNFNSTPNFAPNATLDEVVAGSQEMFMESVKNLVQTMTEKIYRDLYEKEASLKEREAIINEREKMVNAQMMSMMNNYNNQTSSVGVATPFMQQNNIPSMGGVNPQMQSMGMNVMNNGMAQQNGQVMMPMSPMINTANISHITQDNIN